jgi:uncharacterized SAM-binding protein YcdF (DUF218 family)
MIFFQYLAIPSFFVFIIFILGFLLFFLKKRKGIFVILTAFLLLYIFSITPVADFFLYPLEKDYSFLTADSLDQANKIVLLLGGREADVLRGYEVVRLSHKMNNQAQVIISGTDNEEAVGLLDSFINRGIDKDNLVIEGRSRNTFENVQNIMEITEQESFFLVTSAYHMNRSLKEFKKMGCEPIPAATDFRRRGGKYTVFDYLPNSRNLRNIDLAFHEYAGQLLYLFY